MSDYETWSRKIDREWAPLLPLAAQAALRFVLDRTLGENQLSVLVQKRHLHAGVWAGEVFVRAGAGLSQFQARSVLDWLARAGLIIRHRVQLGWVCRINPEGSANMGLKTPKKKEAGAEACRKPLLRHAGNRQSDKRYIYTYEGNESSKHSSNKLVSPDVSENVSLESAPPSPKRSEDSALPVREKLDGVLQDVLRRSAEVQRRRLEKAKQKPGDIGTRASAVWSRLCTQLYLDVCRKQKDMAVLSSHARRYAERCPNGPDFIALLEWCLERWALLKTQLFAWMSDAPELPLAPFFVRWSDRFEAAYRDRVRLEQEATLSEREQIVRRARRKGMTDEAAERTADERTGLTAERRELEKVREEVRRERRALAFTPKPAAPKAKAEKPADLKSFQKPKHTTKKGEFGTWD